MEEVFLPCIDWMSELKVKSFRFLDTYIINDKMYCDLKGRILSSLNTARQEVLLVLLVIILIALFCNLNTTWLLDEFPQKIIPYVMTE